MPPEPRLVKKCSFCEFETKSAKALSFHMEHLHRLIQCRRCSFKTNSVEGYASHIGQHHETLPILRCDKCKFEATDEKHLELHKNTHKNLHCDKCNFDTTDEKEWELHKKECESLLQCAHCSFNTRNLQILENHNKISHTPILKCKYCGFSTKSVTEVEEHMNSHTNCPQCEFTSTDMSEIAAHKSIHLKKSSFKNKSKQIADTFQQNPTSDTNRASNTSHSTVSDNSHPKPVPDASHSNSAVPYSAPIIDVSHTGDDVAVQQTPSNPSRVILPTPPPEPPIVGLGSPHLMSALLKRVPKSTVVPPKIAWQSKADLNKKSHPTQTGLFHLTCLDCSFQTGEEKVMQTHLSVHANPPETTYANKVLHKCKICKFSSADKLHIKTHRELHETNKILYKCSFCEYKTKSSENAQSHKKTHQTSPKVHVYSCDKCPFKTSNHAGFRSHSMTHDIVYFSCAQCNFHTNDPTEKLTHQKSHGGVEKDCGEPALTCDKCQLLFQTIDDLTEHKNNHDDLNVSEPGFLKCKYCEFFSNSDTDLSKHVNECPNRSKNWLKCPDCPFQTRFAYFMDDHQQTHSENPNDKEEFYKCSICFYYTPRKVFFVRHMLNKHNKTVSVDDLDKKDKKKTIRKTDGMFKCKECSYETKWRGDLNKHVKKYHEVVQEQTG